MTLWIVTDTQQYSENTPEYGCGDYPDQIDYVVCIVSADTYRKAQNAAKHVVPRLLFGGMFGARLRMLDEVSKKDLKPADPRLRGKALERHRVALATAQVMFGGLSATDEIKLALGVR
jgi:hypothetical protein